MTFIIHPVSDLCARLKNASLAGHKTTKIVYSKYIVSVLKALKLDGYIRDHSEEPEQVKNHKFLTVELKYYEGGIPVIRYINPISKPSKRVYLGAHSMRPREQFATIIVSTSQGVFSHHDARRKNVGGEVLLEVAT